MVRTLFKRRKINYKLQCIVDEHIKIGRKYYKWKKYTSNGSKWFISKGVESRSEKIDKIF